MELYLSTDVEADGPIPGPHSMLSFASAAFLLEPEGAPPSSFRLVGTFSRNLHTLPGAAPHPETAAWWRKHKQAYEATRRDLAEPEAAMRDYVAWIKMLETTAAPPRRARAVFVAYPVTFDFLFVYWYLRRFAGESPFSHSGLDVQSYAMALLGRPFRATTKAHMPRAWFSAERPHTHVALDDALEQGELFCRMLIDAAARRAADAPTAGESPPR
jgi:hypothetical protein